MDEEAILANALKTPQKLINRKPNKQFIVDGKTCSAQTTSESIYM